MLVLARLTVPFEVQESPEPSVTLPALRFNVPVFPLSPRVTVAASAIVPPVMVNALSPFTVNPEAPFVVTEAVLVLFPLLTVNEPVEAGDSAPSVTLPPVTEDVPDNSRPAPFVIFKAPLDWL